MRQAAEVAKLAKHPSTPRGPEWEQEYLHPGEKQCQFCSAKGECPRAGEAVVETVMAEFVDLDAKKLPVITSANLTPIPADVKKLAALRSHLQTRAEIGRASCRERVSECV